MEHGHDNASEFRPSGAQVREHWDNWKRFTGMTKKGIIVVVLVVVFALYWML